MAANEEGTVVAEADVIVYKNAKRDNRTRRCCYVILILIFLLLLLALVGFFVYFLLLRHCTSSLRQNQANATGNESGNVFEHQGGNDEDMLTGRLPRTVVPLRYNITITPYLYPEDVKDNRSLFTFDGHVGILMECIESTNRISIHSNSMEISQLSVYNDQMENIQVVSYEEDFRFEILQVDLGTNLSVGTVYMMAIAYSRFIDTELVGFFKTSYEDGSGKTR